jgi:pyruvate dehydrogenase E2 component (dihydrolipoamide acetyltransferase)
MPALGAGMDVGRVLEWYVAPGERVRRGGIIALVETDKANIEVECFEDGIVEELLVEPGTKVPVGTPLARIDTSASAPAGTAPAAAAPAEVAPSPPVAAPAAAGVAPVPAAAVSVPVAVGPAAEAPPVAASPLVRRDAARLGLDLREVHGSGPGGVITRHDVAVAVHDHPPGAPPHPAGLRASPFARRLAAERGVDLATLTGSGPDGVVVARDLPSVPTTTAEHAIASAAPATPPPAPAAPTASVAPPPTPVTTGEAGPSEATTEDRALAMRQAIARAMERANRDIPHYYLGETVDVEDTLRWLTERNADRPPAARVLPAAVVLRAVALALREYPDFNGYWVDDAFRPGDGIHLGVAINLRRGGLLAPAIRDADERSLDELMEALKDLVQRTRSGGLRGSELTDATITVSNLGDTGVERIDGVITPPQVALVGVGRITQRPWAVDGMLAVRRTMALSLAGDHRASDGHRGGRFLAAIATNLRRPEML